MSTMKNEAQTNNTDTLDYGDPHVCNVALHDMDSPEMFYLDHDLQIESETEFEIGLSNLEDCHNGFKVTLEKGLDYDDNEVIKVVFRNNGGGVITRVWRDFDDEIEALEYAFEYISEAVDDDCDRTIHPTRFEAFTDQIIAMTSDFEGAKYSDDFDDGTCRNHIWFYDGQTQYQVFLEPDMMAFEGGFEGLGAVVSTFTPIGQSTKLVSENELVQILSSI